MKPDANDILVCNRISDGEPVVQSRVDACAQCGAALWRALSSPALPQAHCRACAWELMSNPPPGSKIVSAPITAAQIEDIKKALDE